MPSTGCITNRVSPARCVPGRRSAAAHRTPGRPTPSSRHMPISCLHASLMRARSHGTLHPPHVAMTGRPECTSTAWVRWESLAVSSILGVQWVVRWIAQYPVVHGGMHSLQLLSPPCCPCLPRVSLAYTYIQYQVVLVRSLYCYRCCKYYRQPAARSHNPIVIRWRMHRSPTAHIPACGSWHANPPAYIIWAKIIGSRRRGMTEARSLATPSLARWRGCDPSHLRPMTPLAWQLATHPPSRPCSAFRGHQSP